MAAINLGGLATAAPKSKAKEKPALPDPTGELRPLVDQAITAKQQVEAHQAVVDTAKDRLASRALVHAFQMYQGRSVGIEDTFQLVGTYGKAQVSLKNAYKLPPDLTEIRRLLGDHAGDVLTETFTIEIDSAAIPAHMIQPFVDELVTLARQLDELLGTAAGEAGPVFSAISVKPVVRVAKPFHEARHTLFTPEQNMAIQRAMPCVTSLRLSY